MIREVQVELLTFYINCYIAFIAGEMFVEAPLVMNAENTTKYFSFYFSHSRREAQIFLICFLMEVEVNLELKR